MATKKTGEGTVVTVPAPQFQEAVFNLAGTAPYVQLKFGKKAREKMRKNQEEGQTAKSKKKREPRDFKGDYEQALHRSSEGWHGIPAVAFRAAMVSACRIVGFHMTLAKLAVFVEADGFDEEDGTPLVRIEGKPEKVEHYVRNANGQPDIRVRAMWRKWGCKVRTRFDTGMFTMNDVTNLMLRVGLQVGIGEGRPDSKKSCGMGWGLFGIEGKKK